MSLKIIVTVGLLDRGEQKGELEKKRIKNLKRIFMQQQQQQQQKLQQQLQQQQQQCEQQQQQQQLQQR